MTESSDDLVALRRQKLQKFRDAGTNPYPARWDATHRALEVLSQFKNLEAEAVAAEEVSVAGRLMTRRDMGKAAFAHLQDASGRIQVYLRMDEMGETQFSPFKHNVDLGDFLGVRGVPFRTKTGEITVRAKSFALLSKALRPPPEKFHGMTDVEERYRRREVDLFSNEDVRRRFLQRRAVVSSMRRVLESKNFIEVETPIMQPIPGGAAARPFTTHHNALDMTLYMRIAPELYLKRLLVGGMDRVFEIGRAFRNEGIDTRHNPEFTILEAYQAYADVGGMMDLTEEIIRAAAREIREVEHAHRREEDRAQGLDMNFSYRGKSFSMAEPFARLSLADLFSKNLGLDYKALCRTNGWREAAGKLGLYAGEKVTGHKCFDSILDEKILPLLPPATFLFGYPAVFSPLAKADQNPDVADRFELFIAGEEVANAYSEQNDPDVQRRHFQDQARRRQAGDEEAMPADEEFLIALEHGMPPAGGLGIGVDRLTMILTGTESIREVILFPLLRPHA